MNALTKLEFTEKFNNHVFVNDSISVKWNGFTLKATIHFDNLTTPTDFDCYSAQDIENWKNEKWCFCGIVISCYKTVSIAGRVNEDVYISKNAASLLGIELNFNENNSHIQECANDLLLDAVEYLTEVLEQLKI